MVAKTEHDTSAAWRGELNQPNLGSTPIDLRLIINVVNYQLKGNEGIKPYVPSIPLKGHGQTVQT